MRLESENAINSKQAIVRKQARKLRLPEHIEGKIRESLSDDRPDDVLCILEENGYCPTDARRVISHVGKDMEQGMLRISWDKPRLMYMTALLKHTLESENKNITASENLLKNYAIFYRIFQDKEGQPIRFGQFDYVMQNIFRGASNINEIFERIASHNTFGEGRFLKAEEVKQLSAEVETAFQEINREYEKAREKRKKLDQARTEAEKEEEQRKGTTWTSTYSEPKEYYFPNYTFQTGSLKGRNHAEGRSSWEPMFLAYADVVNKWMEDKIKSRTDISDEEKEQRIKRYRIELLYEYFDFPVDVQTTKDGVEKPVIYRLDFLDINRWRAIEVKGPLTAKGAEKIRLFKKYYVEEDFSGLSPDKQMLMMSYVQDKKEEIANWCREQDYPVRDHFQSLTVLGAWKWDHAINNFNKYSGAKDMPGLSKSTIDHLQKGFFKLIEERIAKGKTPDIRPEEYQSSDGLSKLIKINEKEAKQKNVPYEITRPSSTNPYIPSLIAKEVFDVSGSVRGQTYLASILRQKILDTIPIPQDKKDIVVLLNSSVDICEYISRSLSASLKENVSRKDLLDVFEGRSDITYTPHITTREDYEKMLKSFEVFRAYLLDLSRSNINFIDNKLNPQSVTKYIKDLHSHFKKMLPPTGYGLKINKDRMNESENLSQSVLKGGRKDLRDIITLYSGFLLGNQKQLFDSRLYETEGHLVDYPLITVSEKDLLQKLKQKNNSIGLWEFDPAVASSLLQLLFHEHKIPGTLLSVFSIANNNLRQMDLQPMKFYELSRFIGSKYKKTSDAAKNFSAHTNDGISEGEYFDVLARIDSSNFWVSDLADDFREFKNFIKSNEKILVSIAKISLVSEIGEEKYRLLNKKYNSYFQ